MSRTKQSDIPFAATDPRYSRVWYQIHKRGKTLDEALRIIGAIPEKPKFETPAPKPEPVRTDDLVGSINRCESSISSLQNILEIETRRAKQDAEYDPFGIVIMILDTNYLILQELKKISSLMEKT